MATKQLEGLLFADMVRGGAANLRANAEIVNDLNVFPIPDGDTGDNMCMTISGGVTTAGNTEGSLSDVSGRLAQGMLLSARGNSGVILSQLFAGISEAFNGIEHADLPTVAQALRSGVRRAYGAVIEPTEGTLLTVAREAAEYACERLGDESTLESFMTDYINEAKRSLDRTPDLLAVLKDAGVVDSGGAGLVYIIEGMNRVLNGGEIVQPSAADTTVSAGLDFDSFTSDSVMTFGYCTEFLLRLQTVGDSIVAFKTGSVVKVHVHTMTPGAVLGFCQQFGEFLTVKIENMTLQHSDATVANNYSQPAYQPGATTSATTGRRKYAVVAVAAGDGIKNTFRSLGADEIVDGGQSMNPSAEDFIAAFDRVNADTVIVMPNNGNVILAAQQAASMYTDSDVRVLASKTVGDGYAALTMLSLDSGDTDAIMAELTDAMNGVVTGMVSRCVRDAQMKGVSVREGDYIGFTGKEILSADSDKTAAACALADRIGLDGRDILIAIRGADTTAEESAALHSYVSEKYPCAEVYEIDGKQEIYSYILVAE